MSQPGLGEVRGSLPSYKGLNDRESISIGYIFFLSTQAAQTALYKMDLFAELTSVITKTLISSHSREKPRVPIPDHLSYTPLPLQGGTK